MRSERSSERTCERRSAASWACWSAIARSSRRARSTRSAFSRFWICDFSSCMETTIPVGRWVTRTAESVVLTDWPPGPVERYTSVLRSAGSMWTSTSSASGRTFTPAAEVWMRPCDSVTGTRWTRCTPASNLSLDHAPLPWTEKMISLNPPSRPDRLWYRISTLLPCCSAQRAYMRYSFPAHSAASAPAALPTAGEVLGLADRLRPARAQHHARGQRLDPAPLGLGQDVLEGADGDLDLVVAGRLGGQHLQPQPRLHDRPDQARALAPRAEPDALVGDADDHRHREELQRHPDQQRRAAGQREADREQHQGDHEQDQQEVGAAAHVQSREAAHVAPRQRQPRLVAVDRLVLGAVVLEDPADVLELRDQRDVAEEEGEPHEPFDQVEGEVRGKVPRQPVGPGGGDQDEQQREEHRADRQRPAHLLIAELLLFAERLVEG